MHYLLKNPYLYFWLKKKHVQSRLNMLPLSVCPTNQTVGMPEIPIMWYPIFGKLMTCCSNLGKQILFEPVKPFKVEKGSPKIGDVMGGFPSTPTQQIIMFIEMTYKLFLIFFIYRLPSCRPLSFKNMEGCD